MNIYHGSNVEVKQPAILPALRVQDFGAGFYCTSSRPQEVKWAKLVARRRNSKEAVLNTYFLDEEPLGVLQVLRFGAADADWLDFVVRNRKEQWNGQAYDLVIGPVANDATLPV